MIPVRSENIKSNNWLAKLSRGDYGVKTTFFHLIAAILWAIANDAFISMVSSAAWAGVAAGLVILYGAYVANIGMGFWRLARKITGEVKAFLLRILAAVCVLAGIASVFNGLNLLFLLASSLSKI